MSELLTDDALSRRVAEIFGWDSIPNIAHNDHLANTTVKEWCGDDPDRIYRFCSALYRITGEVWTEHISDIYVIATASATQKCQALVAAHEALEGK
jgi:hypothetical protein